jgi:deoxyribose-phosphate aldolase
MNIAQMIDHTLLKPDATPQQIAQICAEAREYGFAAVCVNPVHVAQAAALLFRKRHCRMLGCRIPVGSNQHSGESLRDPPGNRRRRA